MELDHLNKLMSLLGLPENRQRLILENDPSIRDLSVKEALKEANGYRSWIALRETFERVMHWRALLSQGYTQSMIAREERLTRARVCQLMKLLRLDEEIWAGVMRGDDVYMGVSIRTLTRDL